MNGHYSVVAVLLVHGADCQMRSLSGLTAAQTAAECGYFDIRDLIESHNKRWFSLVNFIVLNDFNRFYKESQIC